MSTTSDVTSDTEAFWYEKTLEKLLKGSIGDLSSLTLKIMAVDSASYAGGLSARQNDEYLSAIPSDARIASAALKNVTVSNGRLDADDVTFGSVTGNQFEALVVYVDTGTESTSVLLCYTTTATGLPYTPSGGDITIVFPSTGIASLSSYTDTASVA